MFSSIINNAIFAPPEGMESNKVFAESVAPYLQDHKKSIKEGIVAEHKTLVQDVGNYGDEITYIKAQKTIDMIIGDVKTSIFEHLPVKNISLIYFHGNSESIYSCFKRVVSIIKSFEILLPTENYDAWGKIHLTAYVFEYPGYFDGKVENIKALTLDLWASDICSQVIQDARELSPREQPMVVLWGYSLGASMACKCLSMTRSCKAILALEAFFPSLMDVGNVHIKKSHGSIVAWLASKILNKNIYEYFDNRAMLTYEKNGTYVICVHALQDVLLKDFREDINELYKDGYINELYEIDGNHDVHLDQIKTYEMCNYICRKLNMMISEELELIRKCNRVQELQTF